MSAANSPDWRSWRKHSTATFRRSCKSPHATRFLQCVTEPEHLDIRNRITTEKLDVLRAMKARDLSDRLLPLLDDANPVIRVQAAMACLALATEMALAILEQAVKFAKFSKNLEKSEAA